MAVTAAPQGRRGPEGIEIALRDKAYLTVLVPSLLSQQCEQKVGLPQLSGPGPASSLRLPAFLAGSLWATRSPSHCSLAKV